MIDPSLEMGKPTPFPKVVLMLPRGPPSHNLGRDSRFYKTGTVAGDEIENNPWKERQIFKEIQGFCGQTEIPTCKKGCIIFPGDSMLKFL